MTYGVHILTLKESRSTPVSMSVKVYVPFTSCLQVGMSPTSPKSETPDKHSNQVLTKVLTVISLTPPLASSLLS